MDGFTKMLELLHPPWVINIKHNFGYIELINFLLAHFNLNRVLKEVGGLLKANHRSELSIDNDNSENPNKAEGAFVWPFWWSYSWTFGCHWWILFKSALSHQHGQNIRVCVLFSIYMHGSKVLMNFEYLSHTFLHFHDHFFMLLLFSHYAHPKLKVILLLDAYIGCCDYFCHYLIDSLEVCWSIECEFISKGCLASSRSRWTLSIILVIDSSLARYSCTIID